jgi:cell division protein FtsB
MRIIRVIWYVAGLVVLAGAVALYAYGRGLPDSYDRYQKGVSEVDRLRSETETLKAEESALKKDIEGLQSDPLEKERAIRRNKGLLKEGERVFRIESKTAE